MVTLPTVSFDGSTPCWIPDVPVTRDDTWRLRVASFGDGYSMRTLDGINALDMSWNLQWMNRSVDVINSMVAFFVANKAKAFAFQEPETGLVYKVFCDKWSISWNSRRRDNAYGTLSAQFAKANGVAP